MKRLTSIVIIAAFIGGVGFYLARAFFGAAFLEPPEPSVDPTSVPVIAATRSCFSVPVSITFANAQRICNEQTPKRFTGSSAVSVPGFRNESIAFDIDREAITLTADADRVSFSIPVSGRAVFHGQFHPVPIGGGIGVQETCDLAGTITGSVKLGINTDWSISGDPTVKLKLSKADVRLLNRINVSLRSEIERKFNEQGPSIAKKAFSEATSKLQLKNQVERAWTSMYLSTQLATAPPLWLNLEPKEIHMRPIGLTDGNAIATDISIVAATSSYLADHAPAVTARALPSLVIEANAANRFEIALPVVVSLATLTHQIQMAIANKTFSAANIRLTVKDVSVHTRGRSILIGFGFSADRGNHWSRADGRLYATGRLVYDKQAAVIRVADLDYDLRTKSIVMTAADWLLKPHVLAEVQRAATLDVAAHLDSATKQVNAYLAAFKFPKELKAELAVNQIALADVSVADETAVLFMNAQGTAAVQIVP